MILNIFWKNPVIRIITICSFVTGMANYFKVFHNSLNVAVDRPPRYDEKNAFPSRRARACPSPCVWLANLITSVDQDRLILIRSGAGAPELQKWGRCAPSLAFLSGIRLFPQGGINTETEL